MHIQYVAICRSTKSFFATLWSQNYLLPRFQYLLNLSPAKVGSSYPQGNLTSSQRKIASPRTQSRQTKNRRQSCQNTSKLPSQSRRLQHFPRVVADKLTMSKSLLLSIPSRSQWSLRLQAKCSKRFDTRGMTPACLSPSVVLGGV